MSQAESQRPVHIVTDSTSDIPAELLAGLPVTVVPLKIEIDGQVYRDLVDISREEILEYLRGGGMPKTSQPSMGEFQSVFRDLTDQGFDVVAIDVSSKLSGTFNSSSTAARSVSEEHISVIDSGSVSIGLGALVLEAAERATAGQTMTEITGHVEHRLDDVWIVAALETLENLRRGGRIGPTAAFLGSALKIKPVIRVHHGEVLPLERVRTFKRARDRLIELTEEQMPFDRLAVLHLGAPEGAADLAERLRARQPGLDVILGQMGTVVGTYGGPGILGIAGLMHPKEPTA